MKLEALIHYLKKWKNAEIISEEQIAKITDYMKTEKHQPVNFFYLLCKCVMMLYNVNRAKSNLSKVLWNH